MQLTPVQQFWQQTAREFADEIVGPRALACDANPDPAAVFDWDIIRQGSKLGFRTLALSKDRGGHEADNVSQSLVQMELARGDVGVASTFSQCWKWTKFIESNATKQQCDLFLPPFVADDTYLMGSAKTEPSGGGSDGRMPSDDPRAGWMLRADRDGDDWVLNGTKHFIGNGPVAKLLGTSTRTDRTVPLREGATLFLVPTDTSGFRVARVHDKIGWRFYQNGELVFEDARIPDAYRVGEINAGFETRERTRGHANIELGAFGVGLCDAALDMALAYARSHRRAGIPLIDHQTVRLCLSEMDMLTEALRALTLRANQEADAGGTLNDVAAMTFASEVVQRVTDLNVEVLGPDSVLRELGAEKLTRDASVWMHIAADNIQRLSGAGRLERKRPAERP